MSLRENERRPLRASRQRKQRPPADPLPSTLHDDQVLTLPEWCRLNSISLKTGQRIMAAGLGPVATQLSPNRIGVTIANNRRWQQTRERA